MGYTIFMNIVAKKFSRPSEDGSAGEGWGEECRRKEKGSGPFSSSSKNEFVLSSLAPMGLGR
ncbi:MAG: hypothetical protein HYX21_03165 [Candidatus Yanofskybacteria bacterium]|nr:hypothetical protein [Candidatus Yanofskybacteria bacterium]